MPKNWKYERWGNNCVTLGWKVEDVPDFKPPPWAAMRDSMPLHKRELADYKNSQRVKKQFKDKNGAAIREREEAEAAAAEAVKEIVKILEFHRAALEEHPPPHANYHKSVNQHALNEAWILLLNSSGCFGGRIHHKEQFIPVQPPRTEIDAKFEKMSKQAKKRQEAEAKAARLQLIKEIAEKKKKCGAV